ncbi:MAG: hypothetical protein WCK89_07070 [bacterium]
MRKKQFLTTNLLPLIIGVAITADLVMAEGQKVPDAVSRMIEKTKSFGLGRYPISFWSYTNLKEHGTHMTEAEVESWADAGFTVPQSPSFDPKDPAQKAHMLRLLDWAQARRMKLILSDPRGYARKGSGDGKQAPPDYAEGFRAAVKDFGSHPGLFGFHVGDEPDADMKESFFACYRIQKEISPKLHPFANLLPYWPGAEGRVGTDTWPHYLDEFVTKSSADLIGYDHYHQMRTGEGGWNGYYENLRLYREAALRNGVPFWNTILSVGHFRYRCPNLDEVRWQFNTTVACGTHGVVWFFYYMREPHANYRLSPVDENWEPTAVYYDIRRVQKNFHRRYGDLFTRLACTRVMFFPKAYGGGQVFQPDGVVSAIQPDKEGHPVLMSEFIDRDGRRYAMVVNNSMTESVNVGITFPSADVKVFSWNWNGAEYEGPAYCAEGSSRSPESLTIRHWLAPGQEAVYRVQSAAAAKEPILP